MILKALFEKDHISQKELSLRVEKDPNTIKAIVDKLEKKEYLKRLKNPSDKRAFLLLLTESGYGLVKALESIDNEVIATISEGLSEDEARVLKSALSKIVENLIG